VTTQVQRAPAGSQYRCWYGREDPPTQTTTLAVGPLTADLEPGELRYLHVGGAELVRRIHVAVRDPVWDTVPGVFRDLSVHSTDGGFSIQFTARHTKDGIDFGWRGRIEGRADGSVLFAMDGEALAEFEYAKIGICVLHPLGTAAGRRYRGHSEAGPVAGYLPEMIAPQVIEDGVEQPLFPAVTELEIDVPDGRTAIFEFAGDLFEMEDQRNWTDASFKTYSTPQHLGSRFRARRGQPFSQQVRFRVAGLPAAPGPTAADDALPATAGAPHDVPRLGLGVGAHPADPIRVLGPDHLRSELYLHKDRWRADLAEAARQARVTGCALELAVHLPGDPAVALAELAAQADDLGEVAVARVLIFGLRDEVTPAELVDLARAELAGVLRGAAFAGGSNIYFNELNRHRPDLSSADAIAYPVCPQLHATDEHSMAETFEGLAATVDTARHLYPGKPIIVSPITLRPRFNAHAGPADDGPGPDAADPRQPSLFTAAWTLGALAALTASDVHSVTWYETSGARGVMADAGSVFPVWHVLADLAELRRIAPARVLTPAGDREKAVMSFLRPDGSMTILAANLTERPLTVTVGRLPEGPARVLVLDAASAPTAGADPAAFREHGWVPVDGAGGRAGLAMPPFGYARAEFGLRGIA
jgi:D-apionolactonase